jgi:hypothetical protein
MSNLEVLGLKIRRDVRSITCAFTKKFDRLGPSASSHLRDNQLFKHRAYQSGSREKAHLTAAGNRVDGTASASEGEGTQRIIAAQSNGFAVVLFTRPATSPNPKHPYGRQFARSRLKDDLSFPWIPCCPAAPLRTFSGLMSSLPVTQAR